ncbi:MAG: hypothetical protein ABI240_14020 [Sphingomonas sp.]
MTAVQYFSSAGPLLLGPSVGRGGEGEVFALADGTGRALKVYEKPDAARETKVRSMVAADLSHACPNVAFPQQIAVRRDGSFIGFTMPLVQGCQPIHELYSPVSRRRAFPASDWRFLVRAALNVARAFANVHATGAVVGDINGSGVLVSRRAVVAMIDADSFQWGTEHLCRVGVPEFTPPELQGRSLTGVTRTINHDGFGLAVMTFLLLFLGRHPHAGRPQGRDVSLTAAIMQGLFAYSAIRQVGLSAPRGTLLLNDLPLGLRTLFERAFAIGVGARPLPAEWVAELQWLEAALTPCTINHRHFRPRPTGVCPWCRVEHATGVSLFGTGESIQVFAGAAQGYVTPICRIVEGTLRRARTGSGEGLLPRYRACEIGPSEKAVEYRAVLDRAFASAVGRIQFVTDIHSKSRFEKRYLRKHDCLNAEIDAWRGRVGAWKASNAAQLLSVELSRYKQLERRRAAELAEVAPRLRAAQVRHKLASIPLASARIAGIGARRLAALSVAGIITAADVSRQSLEALRGLGERAIVAMILWRDALAVHTGRQAIIPAADVAAASSIIDQKYQLKLRICEKTLDRMVRELEHTLDDVASKAWQRDADLDAARFAFDQAAMDLRFLGLSKPSPPAAGHAVHIMAALSKTRAHANTRAKAKAGKNCPKCGGAMIKRWPRVGTRATQPFLGCVKYPACSGSRRTRKAKP